MQPFPGIDRADRSAGPSRARLPHSPLRFRLRSWIAACLTAILVILGQPLAAQRAPGSDTVTLEALLDSVAARHPTVRAAQARVGAARGARVTAGAFRNPMLSYDVENAPLPGRMSPPMERETMVMATFPLEVLYQRGPAVRRANGEIQAAEAEATVARQRMLLGAARAFYRAALAERELDAARDLGGWLDTIVAYNAIRVAEGVAAEADLLRSRLERDRASADAAVTEAELMRARADIAGLLGDASAAFATMAMATTDDPLAMPTASLLGPDLAAPPDDPTGRGASGPAAGSGRPLISAALAGRGETRAAHARLSAASASIVSERRMRVRDLGATIGTKRSEGSLSLLAGVSLPVPLFDLNRGEIMRATAERDAAAFELAAEERAVSAEVMGAYEAARVLTDRATTLGGRAPDGYLARADEARRIALGAYQEGAIPLMQVIDAARAWGEARVAFYRTLFAQHESVLMLLAARGIDLAAAVPSRGTIPPNPTR
jgi:cobalt-zinc-cadmium efflux system outer membrane protein